MLDLTGKQYGRLRVVGFAGKNSSRHNVWHCLCRCGNKTVSRDYALIQGRSRSCGCLHRDHLKLRTRSKVIPGERFNRLTILRRVAGKRGNIGKNKTHVLCLCDCGNRKVILLGSLKSGYTKSCGCLKGDGHTTDKHGYVMLWMPDHPDSGRTGYIYEHRLVMEKHIGRRLRKHETVHHKNGVKNDNRPENLELWSSSHAAGQRTEDKIAWAKDILRLYEPDSLR